MVGRRAATTQGRPYNTTIGIGPRFSVGYQARIDGCISPQRKLWAVERNGVAP
jgi:hypothetical protein